MTIPPLCALVSPALGVLAVTPPLCKVGEAAAVHAGRRLLPSCGDTQAPRLSPDYTVSPSPPPGPGGTARTRQGNTLAWGN